MFCSRLLRTSLDRKQPIGFRSRGAQGCYQFAEQCSQGGTCWVGGLGFRSEQGLSLVTENLTLRARRRSKKSLWFMGGERRYVGG